MYSIIAAVHGPGGQAMAGDHLRRDRPVDHYFEKEKMSNFVEKELKELEERVKDISFTELITCHPSMVQVKVRSV